MMRLKGLLGPLSIIFFAGVCPNLAIGKGALKSDQGCHQMRLMTVYPGSSGPLYQEAVGTAITWTPDQKNYVLTVAHAVAKSLSVVGICQNEIIPLRMIGLETDSDVSVLAPVDSSQEKFLRPLFNLPQGPIEAAQKVVESKKVQFPAPIRPKKFHGPGSEIQFPFVGALGDPRLRGLAMMHPFFATSNIANESVRIAYNEWRPEVVPELSLYRFQSLSIISQVILSRAFDAQYSNPFSFFRPYYLTMGVRPGMSGAPIFQYIDKNLDRKLNLFVGLVSKTKSFENMTLLVPSEVVDSALQRIFTKQPLNTRIHFDYEFSALKGALYPTISLGSQNRFANACDADFYQTADLHPAPLKPATTQPNVNAPQSADDKAVEKLFADWRRDQEKKKSQDLGPLQPAAQRDAKKESSMEEVKIQRGGGDWGDGGGSPSEFSGYLYNPYFTESRYVPRVQCLKSGIVNQRGERFVAYRVKDAILPVRSLDQFVEILRQQDFDQKNLVTADRHDEVSLNLCRQAIAENALLTKISWIMPLRSAELKSALNQETVQVPPGVLFQWPDHLDEVNIRCDSQMRLQASLQLGEILSLSLRTQDQRTNVVLQLGRCQISSDLERDGFEYRLHSAQANVKLFLEKSDLWALQISQISPSCGFKIDPKFQGAIRVEIPTGGRR